MEKVLTRRKRRHKKFTAIFRKHDLVRTTPQHTVMVLVHIQDQGYTVPLLNLAQ